MRLDQELKLIGKGSFEVFSLVLQWKTTSRVEHTFVHNLNKKSPHWVLRNGGSKEEQMQEFQIFVNCSLFYPNKKIIFQVQRFFFSHGALTPTLIMGHKCLWELVISLLRQYILSRFLEPRINNLHGTFCKTESSTFSSTPHPRRFPLCVCVLSS